MKYLLIGLIVVLVILVLWVVATYNALVRLKNKVRDELSQIDVALKRRFDLIPNLVETVKGYAGHESETLEKVISARNKAVSASSIEEKMQADNQITGALNKLFALAENYPDLKANTNFLELQKEISETENKITYARQFYNDSVLSYKNKLEMFPSNIIAGMFGFTKKEVKFFETKEEEKEVPQVKF